jgi:hypothetical protein
MGLHRADKIPDWERVPETYHNSWQRIAKRTRGIITPGNIVSLAGGVLVGAGLKDIQTGRKTRGVILVGQVEFLI